MRRVLTSLLMIAMLSVTLAGSSLAVFSESEQIEGNTISAATVDIDLRGLGSGNIDKPLAVAGMIPGEWTDWARAEIYNTSSSTDVKVFFYVTDVTGDACSKTNLMLTTGHAGGNEQAHVLHNGKLNDVKGYGKKVEITGPIFPMLEPNITAVVQQKAGLDSTAGNNLQGTSCQWTEVFLAETPEL